MISVIVVAYQSAETLDDCLASVAPLITGGNELWLVDNASTDGAVDRAVGRFPLARVVRLDRNVGFGAANNVAAQRAEGDRLLLLNPDAWLAEGCADRLSSALDDDSRLGQVAPTVLDPEGRYRVEGGPTLGVLGEAIQRARSGCRMPWISAGLARLALALGDPGWLSGSCFLVRRDAWQAVEGFDERYFLYFEDVDLSVRLRTAGWRIGRCPEATAFHVGGKKGPQERFYRRSQLLYYRLHRPRWENRFLVWWLRRRFRDEPDTELRNEVLGLLNGHAADLADRVPR